MALKLPGIFGRSSSNGAEPQPAEQFTLDMEGEHAGHLIHAEKNQDIEISSSDVGAEEPQSLAAELLLEDLAVDPRGASTAAGDATNQRGSVHFEDIQMSGALPEVGDEVLVDMLNNKNPELTRYENLVQDGKFGPEVLSLDKSSPKLAEAVAQPPTEADGILPYLEQQPYHGGSEAMQDVFVTEAVAPAQDVFVTEIVSPPPTESQVSVFGFGGGVDEAARGTGDASRYENMVPSEFAVANAPQAMQDVFVTEFTGSDEELGALVAWLRNRNLIDTSTGEIVWADEARAEENSEIMGWLSNHNLIDTSTGEIVWVRQPAPGADWYVPDMDSDQSGMAIESSQVNVGGFGGGVDDDRVRVATGDVNNDGVPEVISGHSGGWSVTGDGSGHGNDTLGASSLLGNDLPPADSFSLNFEEIKQTVIGAGDLDLDGGDADIEIPD